MPYTTPSSDFYSLLQIPRDASPKDIKTAYHRILLRLHPDKRSQHGVVTTMMDSLPESIDVAHLKEAYRTLSEAGVRAAYDDSLRQEERARPCGPRPAQIVSLEELTPVTETGAEADADTAQEWWHKCRCGGTYRITQNDLENGTHLVGCESCSEVIWVGYEEAPVTEEGE